MGSTGRVVIAGGSGFLGTSLSHHLAAAGWDVVVLSRSAATPRGDQPARVVRWDARTTGDWVEVLNSAVGLINLTGRTVDCIKTPDHRDEILRSRVESTRVLGLACRAIADPPPVWVQMSTAHIYGDPPEVFCDEHSPTGLGLAPEVGRAWEASFHESILPAQRGVVLRTSFVVGRPNTGGSGALGKQTLLARLGLGGRVGSGRQGISWIHERDLNRLFERGLTDEALSGVFVASAPNPIPQAEFARELRRRAGGLGALGLGLPTAAWMVRLGAPLLLRTDPELALCGRYVVSRRLKEASFEFTFPTVRAAVDDLFRRVT